MSRGRPDTYYSYVFHETTGQNQYVDVMGREMPITFDAAASDPRELASLMALRYTVLYGNCTGGRIFLKGTYHPRTGRFILCQWAILVPFTEFALKNDADPLGEVTPVKRAALRRTDFEPRSGFDPSDPGFDPAAHELRAAPRRAGPLDMVLDGAL